MDFGGNIGDAPSGEDPIRSNGTRSGSFHISAQYVLLVHLLVAA